MRYVITAAELTFVNNYSYTSKIDVIMYLHTKSFLKDPIESGSMRGVIQMLKKLSQKGRKEKYHNLSVVCRHYDVIKKGQN